MRRPFSLPATAPVRVLLTVLLTGLATAGCGHDGTPGPTPPEPEPGSPSAAAPVTPVTPGSTSPAGEPPSTVPGRVRAYCDGLASPADVERTAGVALTSVEVQKLGSTPGCVWRSTGGAGGVVLEVVDASSSTWGAQIPAIASSLQRSGVRFDAALSADLRRVRGYLGRAQEVDADLACTVFSELAAVSGSPSGVDATVRVTSQGGTQAITAQSCSADEYAFVRLSGPQVTREDGTGATQALLEQVRGVPLHFS